MLLLLSFLRFQNAKKRFSQFFALTHMLYWTLPKCIRGIHFLLFLLCLFTFYYSFRFLHPRQNHFCYHPVTKKH